MILYNSSAGRKVESFQYSQSYTRHGASRFISVRSRFLRFADLRRLVSRRREDVARQTYFASLAVFRLVQTQGAPRVCAIRVRWTQGRLSVGRRAVVRGHAPCGVSVSALYTCRFPAVLLSRHTI